MRKVGKQSGDAPEAIARMKTDWKSTRTLKDLGIVLIVAVVVYALAHALNLFEKFLEFSRKYETWQIDEWFITLIALSFLFIIFSILRSRELIHEIGERNRSQEALQENEEKSKRIAQENATMAEIGRIISSTLNIEEVYERFAKEVAKLITFDRIVITLINPTEQTANVAYLTGIELPNRRQGGPVPLSMTVTGEAARRRECFLIQGKDEGEVTGSYPALFFAFRAGLRSFMMVPLIYKDQVIAVLNLRSLKVNAYTDEDLRVAEKVGNQIAGAIANAQLFAERLRAEESLRRSEEESKRIAQENATMAEIGRIIGSTLDTKEVYEHFAEATHKLIPFDRISISIINSEQRTTVVAYAAGVEISEHSHGNPVPLAGTFTEEAVKTRKSQLIQGEEEEIAHQYPGLRFSLKAKLRSMLSVPLISKDEVIGVLHLRSAKPTAYTKRDLRVAESIGSQIAGAIANGRLFVERVQAEQKARSLEEQLFQSQKMEAIGRLAGGIAHDFNNLMTIVKGYSQLSLLTLKEGDPLKGHFEEIQRAADRAANLTHQLLAFSRRQILEFKVLDLNNILRNLDKMLRRIIGEDIELSYQLSNDLGKIKTDPGQIEQVILNLAVNAKDAMPCGGKLTIETVNGELNGAFTHNHVGKGSGRYVMLSVSDTGNGMSREVQEHLFEPFFTTKEVGKGTGLGLSTAYGIVKQSEGNIEAYSEPGKGTTFKIYLPRVEEEVNPLPFKDAREPQPHRIDKDLLPLGRETVLLVEDEGPVRKIAIQVLRESGYTLLEAANGEEALRIVQEQINIRIHLLLTDVIMPQMGGKELAQKIKPLQPGIKILFISGYTDDAIFHHGILGPGIDFLQKPFAPSALAQKVREVLDK